MIKYILETQIIIERAGVQPWTEAYGGTLPAAGRHKYFHLGNLLSSYSSITPELMAESQKPSGFSHGE